MALGLFARDNSVNAPRLFELYFLLCKLENDRVDLGAFLAQHLHSATTSIRGIKGIITSIARFLGVEPNLNDRVFGSKSLHKVAFELMSFCLVKARHLCWIHPGDRLMLLSNVP